MRGVCQVGRATINESDAEDVMALYERALQIKTRAYGREHPDVAYTLNSMANFYAEAGK